MPVASASDHLYQHYASLRTHDPVKESARGVWLLTRYNDVYSVLRDRRVGRNGFLELSGPRKGGAEGPEGPMQFQDPPAHTRLRNLVSRVLGQSLGEGVRAHVQDVVDKLLNGIRDAGRMDVIADFGWPLSLRIIIDLLGVPDTDYQRFEQWSRIVTRGMDEAGADAISRGVETEQAIGEYFRDLIAERRKLPRNDIVSGLIAAARIEDGWRESELLDICGLLFVAGHATMVNLIGNGLLNLLLHPAELRRLREEPGLIAQAVEELLRFESPVQRVGRVVTEGFEIRGKAMPKGAVICAMLGAANRDTEQFALPERLDIMRTHNRHLAFGLGAHGCIGAPLARLEGQIAIGTIIRDFPNLALVIERVEWREHTETRGLKELQVTF